VCLKCTRRSQVLLSTSILMLPIMAGPSLPKLVMPNAKWEEEDSCIELSPHSLKMLTKADLLVTSSWSSKALAVHCHVGCLPLLHASTAPTTAVLPVERTCRCKQPSAVMTISRLFAGRMGCRRQKYLPCIAGPDTVCQIGCRNIVNRQQPSSRSPCASPAAVILCAEAQDGLVGGKLCWRQTRVAQKRYEMGLRLRAHLTEINIHM
jgi:hypothetical protein